MNHVLKSESHSKEVDQSAKIMLDEVEVISSNFLPSLVWICKKKKSERFFFFFVTYISKEKEKFKKPTRTVLYRT